jgi:hypothetical protein
MIGIRFSAANFLIATTFMPTMETTQPPNQEALEYFFEEKRTECEAGGSPKSGTEVSKAWSYTSTHPIRLYTVVLSHRENLVFQILYNWDI